MKQRLLYVTPFFNVPPTDGGSLRALNLLVQLVDAYDVTLLTYTSGNGEIVSTWCRNLGITLYSFTTPARYGVNASFLQRLFSRQLPGFASHDSVGITSDIKKIWQFGGPFHIVYFATQLVAQALLLQRWPARYVIDLYDVYTTMAQEKQYSLPWYRRYHWLFRIEAERIKYYERRILARADCILTVSDVERSAVSKLVKRVPLVTIPNGAHLPQQWSAANSHQVITVGSYHYEPNLDGVRWFYRYVWPKVLRALPDAQWIIIGSGHNPIVELVGNDPSVVVTGRVPDLVPYYQDAACAVVPIHSGGGTRLKLLEAMAWAVPVVTTTKGAEGVEHAGTVMVADTIEMFAKYVTECLMYTDEASSRALQARRLIAERYSWSKIGEQLHLALAQHAHTY